MVLQLFFLLIFANKSDKIDIYNLPKKEFLMKKRILTKALSVMLCGTAVVQTGLSVTPPIMAHAETPDENGVLITNPMQTVSFYDMFGEPYDTKFPIRYDIWEMDGNEMKKKVSGPWNASPNNNYKVITDYLRKTNERGELIKYMVRPIPENPFEVDYDKTTETHLAVKIRKTYSDKIIKVEFRQRNGKYLVPHQVGINRVRLTPLLNKPDEKIKPVEIDVIGNYPYQLREHDAIFTTDRYGNPLKYDIDLIDYYSDLNYEYYMSTKTLPSMYATISGDDTVPTTPFVDKDGNFVVINVRKNERDYQDFWVNWINNNEYNNLQEIHNNIRVNFTADRGPAIPETTLKNTLHDYPFRNAVILPGFTEDTDLPITYTPSVKNISGYQVYLHRDQHGGESFNETGPYHARKSRNVIQIYKKVNNIKIYLRDYNGIAKLNADPKIKKITARIKKDGVTLQELTLQRYGGSSDYIDYIDEDKVPMEDGSGNIINYDLEVDMPEGYEDGRIASDQPAHQPGNKFRAILKRKLVPLNKTIKLNFVPGTKLPETNITAVIKKDGEIKDAIILNQVNNWTATSSNTTPLYDTKDNKINYTIEIQKPAGYVISEPVITDTLNTYTLTKGEPKLSGNISVKFEDYNGNKKTGNESYLPENVTISFVSKDGSQGNSDIHLTKDSGYTYDISTLPKEKPDGDDYDYVLTAPKITGYDAPVINGYEVTYKRTKETIGANTKPVKAYFKKYDTTSDDALTAKTIANPDVNSVTVRLKNGETVTLTKENGYTLNLTEKPKYDTNDNVIDYSVDHVDAPNGYELLKIEGNKDIVLRAIPEHYTTTISANFKSYNDNKFKGSTEDYINVTIFRTTADITNNNFDEVTGEEVKTVTLDKDDDYSVTLTDLPKTNPDGEAYHYFIKMDNITGFEKTYTKNEADGNLTLGVTHKRIKLFTTRKVKIKFVNKDGSAIACNPINKIKLTIYRNGDKLEEKDVTITNAETDIILTGLLYHEEESNYNGRLYNYEIVPSEEEGFNVVKDIVDDGFSSHIITYTSVKKLDTPCTDLTPTEPIDKPTPPEKEVIPWTDLVPATPIKPDTPSEPEKPSIPWTDLIPATPIIDNTQTIPVIPTVPDIITTPLIPVIQPVTETVATPAVISDSGIVAPVEPKVTTESGVQVIPDIPVTKDDTNNTGEKQEKPKHEPDEQIKTPNKTIGVNHETNPIRAAKIKKLKELQRKKELRERLNRAKIRKTLPKTGGTNIYYSIVPGSILLLSAMGLMLKGKKKK